MELVVYGLFGAPGVCRRHQNRNSNVAVGAVDDLDVDFRERLHDRVDDAGIVAHRRPDHGEFRTGLAHAHRQVQIAEQAANLRAAISFDDEHDAGLIDGYLIDGDAGVRDALKHLQLDRHAAFLIFDVAPDHADPRYAAGSRHARYGLFMLDVFVDDGSLTGTQSFDRVRGIRAVRQVGRLVVHDFRAVLGELGHLFQARSFDGVRTGDAARIAGHRAAYVGVDVDARRLERVTQRNRGEIAAASAERRHLAVLGHALKTRDHRHGIALEHFTNAFGFHADDFRIAVRRRGNHARLRAAQRNGVDSLLLQRIAEHGGGNEFRAREQYVTVARTAAIADERQKRVGRIGFGRPSHRGNDRNRRVPAIAFLEQTGDGDLTQFRRRYGRAAELENDRLHGFSRRAMTSSKICTPLVAAPFRS